MGKLRHNKKRDLGIVYEILARELTDATIAKDGSRAAAVLSIMEKHLGPKGCLHEELSLHREVMEARGCSPTLAQRIIDNLKIAGLRFSAKAKARERAKSDLIHEMNRVLGRDIFDRYRIPDYTAHASVNILMSRGLDARIDESVDYARVEEHLSAYLLAKSPQVGNYDPDATFYAYRTAVGLFESEIGRELDEHQLALLREYVRVSLGGNPAPFERTFERQRKQLTEKLRVSRVDEVFAKDPEMADRLNEAISELESLRPSVTDEAVERLMLFHNLRREIES